MSEQFRLSSRLAEGERWTLPQRAWLKGDGFCSRDLEKPVIGICNSWSELNHCNRHLPELAELVKRGVWQAGGLPLEFPTISLGEMMLSPTSMLYRNLMAMDVEEMIRAQPLDGVVLLGGCDKTIPAQLMGAASADKPAIMLPGGPMLNGHWRGRVIGACSDCRFFAEEYRAGKLSRQELDEIEDALCPSPGHCMVMGTASTMAVVAEALGMTLPQAAALPAVDPRRRQLAEATGRQAVELVRRNLRPSDIITPASLANAVRACIAVGGSTNAVIHLPAIAGRLGIALPWTALDRLSRTTPWLANLRPAGQFQMEEFARAGGVPAILAELKPLLHSDAMTVSGVPLEQTLRGPLAPQRDVIASADAPLKPEGGLAFLTGNLCPDGAVIKHAAATPQLLQHRGRAVVFDSMDDLQARIDAPDLDVTPDSVLVLRNAGPKGGPGMPEWGQFGIPKKLLDQGVRDMVRICDARTSGTSFGTLVLHVAPESAVGGPLAAVRDGDPIQLDVQARTLTLCVSSEEIARRLAQQSPPRPRGLRGYGWLYHEHVLQAPQGCDFDFCVPARDRSVSAP